MHTEIERLRQRNRELERKLSEFEKREKESSELKRSEEKYRALVENSLQGFAIIQDDRFVFCNGTLASMTGYSVEELMAFPDSKALVHPEDQAMVQARRQDRLTRKTFPARHEHRIIRKDGAVRWVEVLASSIEYNGRPAIQVVNMDITEQKRLQQQFIQSQKMEAVGMLAGGVAHDFNNLLTVIKGYAEVIESSLRPQDPLRRDLEQILKAANQASKLTSQLLAFSRKQILQPEILDLNAVILNMSSMLRRLIGEHIDFVTRTQPDLGFISADPGQMQQILLNLAVNARDAMPQGGQLTIETANAEFDDDYVLEHPQTRPGPYVMLAVSDSGLGMDPETQAHLFEPFFTTKEKGKGTGLGLATGYGIVKQSGGFIWVYSEAGRGTTFKIYFPRVEGKKPELKAESKAESLFGGNETVLVVEDEASVRALTSRILRERGYNILQASNGNEAFEIARKYEGVIHLLITDVVMPGMGGKALASQFQTIRPETRVLYVYGYTDNAIVHQGILDSGVSFLQKPFTVDNLARKVRTVLDA